MGRLAQILDYDFKNLDEDFMLWEAEIRKFETETASLLPSMVKTAVLMNKIEGPLQQHLQLNASHSTDFRQVREMVLNFSKAKTSFKKNPTTSSTSSTFSSSSPMEVDAINKGKGKGKDGKGKGKDGKGKGKGKGPSDNAPADDPDPSWTTWPSSSWTSSSTPWCASCGKKGHSAEHCWTYPPSWTDEYGTVWKPSVGVNAISESQPFTDEQLQFFQSRGLKMDAASSSTQASTIGVIQAGAASAPPAAPPKVTSSICTSHPIIDSSTSTASTIPTVKKGMYPFKAEIDNDNMNDKSCIDDTLLNKIND